MLYFLIPKGNWGSDVNKKWYYLHYLLFCCNFHFGAIYALPLDNLNLGNLTLGNPTLSNLSLDDPFPCTLTYLGEFLPQVCNLG